jgi:methylmalonyl-CoA/ethylmalonyl-CoA epimerase
VNIERVTYDESTEGKGMIEKIDHIGIAVKSLDNALNTYKKIYGLEASKIEILKEIKVRIAFIPLGETLIELLEPTEPGAGRIGQFLEERGEGIHHIAFRVKDIGQTLTLLKEMNTPLRDKEPRDGGDGSRIAFIEPVVTQNVLTELVEREQDV